METLGAFIPLLLILAVFYFFFIRPQNKQQKELQEMRNNMKVGDEVITIGGFYGIIYAIDDKNVVLEMLPDFHKLMVIKTAISRVITEEESVVEETSGPKDELDEIEDVNITDEVENNDTDQSSENTEEKDTSKETEENKKDE